VNIDPRRSSEIPRQAYPATPVAAREADRARTGGPFDRIEISAGAEAFQRARARLAGAPDTDRQARVAELRAALERADYQPDGITIAGAILQDETVYRVLGLTRAR
jgi:flagellar biosynthesis anti-sigma factor FlgM